MTLPANMGTCQITGTFIRAVADTADPDRNPDSLPIEGMTVRFTASVPVVRNMSAAPPTTVFIDPIACTTDASGTLIGPDGQPGVLLVASDDPDLDPSGWTYTVWLSAPSITAVQFSFVAPVGGTVDLSTVVPVPASPGAELVAWQEAVAATEAARDEAVAAADEAVTAAADAEAIAAAIPATNDPIVAALINDPASQTGTALSAAIAAETDSSGDIGDDIWLIMGQSNAVGYGEGGNATYLDVPDARVFQFGGAAGDFLQKRVVAIDPLFHQQPAASFETGIGFGLTFAKLYARTIDMSRQVLLVPTARGETNFAGSTYSWEPGKIVSILNLFENAMVQVRAALAMNPNNRFVGVLWHQGEGDTNYSPENYAGHLDDVIDTIRAEFGNNVLFLVGQMVPDRLSYNAGYPVVNAAHIDTPRRKTLAGFAYGIAGEYASESLGGTVHYNAAGQRFLGQSFFEALRLARANVTGTPPVIPGKVTVEQSGTTLNVSWVRTPGRVTDYIVQYSINGGAWTVLTRAQSIDNSATIPGMTLGASVLVSVATVNEQGTSVFRAADTFVLATIPAQVTGLTLGETGSNRQTLTWTPVAGATSYLVQYKASASGTWLDFGVVDSAAVTVTGLGVATAYDYRVQAINAAGSGIASSTVSATTLALDTFAAALTETPLNSYSMRKALPAYSGSAIRVRNDAGALLDIGFTGLGVLDEAALLTHCGTGGGTVHTWYDQGSAGTNLVQETTALQPIIVTAGVVEKQDGVPAVKFTGTQWMAHAAVPLYAAAQARVFALYTAPAASQTMAVFGEDNGGLSGGRFFPIYHSSSAAPTWFTGTARQASGYTADGLLRQVTAIYDASDWSSLRINGAQALAPASQVTTTPTFAGTTLGAMRYGAASAFYTGKILELHTVITDLADTKRDTAEANLQSLGGI